MSRYDRSRSKQPSKTAFIFTILVSLFIGVSGTYYVLQNYKHNKAENVSGVGNTVTNETAVTDKSPDNQQVRVENGNEARPTPPDSATVPSNEPINQKSGLPDLLSSDRAFRRALIKLSPGLVEWLSADQLIRRYVVIANDFSQGLRILKHVSFLRFEEAFAVEQGENGLQIAPKSYRRYDKLAQAIEAVDAKAAVAVYQKFRPLMLQVFAEFSYPKDITLESVVKKAASEILAAPVLEGQHAVVRPSLFYKFADPKLEALNPVQKQMLRMGAQNMRTIQNKCREFLVELAKSGLE
jgi:Protein of unknown function (DUF3014)